MLPRPPVRLGCPRGNSQARKGRQNSSLRARCQLQTPACNDRIPHNPDRARRVHRRVHRGNLPPDPARGLQAPLPPSRRARELDKALAGSESPRNTRSCENKLPLRLYTGCHQHLRRSSRRPPPLLPPRPLIQDPVDHQRYGKNLQHRHRIGSSPPTGRGLRRCPAPGHSSQRHSQAPSRSSPWVTPHRKARRARGARARPGELIVASRDSDPVSRSRKRPGPEVQIAFWS